MSAFRLDTLPLPLDRAEFDLLAAAAIQRMGVLEQLLADLFGPRMLVRERIVPAQVLYALRGFRPSSSVSAGRWLVTYAMDVVRCADGRWRVVRDLTDAPPGLGRGVARAQRRRPRPAGRAAAGRGGPDRPALRRAAPGPVGLRAARPAQPALRAAHARTGVRQLRRALVPGDAARLPPGRGRRPGHARGSPVAARARRAGGGRRPVPARRATSSSTRSSPGRAPASASPASSGAHSAVASAWPTPRAPGSARSRSSPPSSTRSPSGSASRCNCNVSTARSRRGARR